MSTDSNKYLGRLCKWDHNYDNTGKSLRYKSNRCCIECIDVFYKLHKIRINKNKSEHHFENRSKLLANSRKRYNENHENVIKKVKKYRRSEHGKIVRTRYKRIYSKINPLAVIAHRVIKDAVKNGIIVKDPCESCGIEINIHGHHDDYTKPFKVRWLCAAHHSEYHRLLRDTEHSMVS